LEDFLGFYQKSKKMQAAGTILLAAFLLPSLVTVAYGDFTDDLLQAGVNLATSFINDPGPVLLESHLDTQDFTPVPSNKLIQVRLNFFPSGFAIFNGGSFKVAPIKEGFLFKQMPQIDVYAGGWSMFLLSVAADMISDQMGDFKIDKLSVSGQTYGAEAVKTVAENTRMYAGYNFSRTGMAFSVDISSITASFGGGFSIEIPDLNASVYDHFIYVGLDHIVRKNKTLAVYTGYGFRYHKIMVGVSYTGRVWEYGMNIYPDGWLVLHPKLSLKLRF